MMILSLELEVDVDFCCVEDVVKLELAVVELVVLVPTGELVLPSNWVTMVIEKRAIMMTRTTKVDRFLVGLIMTCHSLSSFSHVMV